MLRTDLTNLQMLTKDFYTGTALSPQNHIIYLGFEKIDPGNQQAVSFWRNYSRLVRDCAAIYLKMLSWRLDALKGDSTEPEDATDFFTTIHGSLENNSEYNSTISRCKTITSDKLIEFATDGIKGALDGFDPVLNKIGSKEVFIVYASKTAITKPIYEHTFVDNNGQSISQDQVNTIIRQFSSGDPKGIKFFKTNFNNLIMSMGCVTQPNSCSTTHMGILRNPFDYIDPAEHYNGISLVFHGFSAQCAIETLGKTVQVNQPRKVMKQILAKTLGTAVRAPLFHELDHCRVAYDPSIAVDLKNLAAFYLDAHHKELTIKTQRKDDTTSSFASSADISSIPSSPIVRQFENLVLAPLTKEKTGTVQKSNTMNI